MRGSTRLNTWQIQANETGCALRRAIAQIVAQRIEHQPALATGRVRQDTRFQRQRICINFVLQPMRIERCHGLGRTDTVQRHRRHLIPVGVRRPAALDHRRRWLALRAALRPLLPHRRRTIHLAQHRPVGRARPGRHCLGHYRQDPRQLVQRSR